MIEYKKVSFRVEEEIYNILQEEARKQYLTVSAYIRKCIDLELNRKGE